MTALREIATFEICKEWCDYLEDPEVELLHTIRGRLSLSEIYVYPDFREATYLADKHRRDQHPIPKIVRGAAILDIIEQLNRIVITGDDQSGKTCLAKMLFACLREKGFCAGIWQRPHFRLPFG